MTLLSPLSPSSLSLSPDHGGQGSHSRTEQRLWMPTASSSQVPSGKVFLLHRNLATQGPPREMQAPAGGGGEDNCIKLQPLFLIAEPRD
jgi:hypothetical protein